MGAAARTSPAALVWSGSGTSGPGTVSGATNRHTACRSSNQDLCPGGSRGWRLATRSDHHATAHAEAAGPPTPDSAPGGRAPCGGRRGQSRRRRERACGAAGRHDRPRRGTVQRRAAAGRARGSAATPIEASYSLDHGPSPDFDPASWRLRIDGLVDRELALSLAELQQRFAPRTEVVTLQCAGNRRAEVLARPEERSPGAPRPVRGTLLAFWSASSGQRVGGCSGWPQPRSGVSRDDARDRIADPRTDRYPGQAAGP
ncbi:MAG: putative oxidoreductase [Modestobacter sp.]|nr:putative oxidoreductase [Modestobacter sp.]